MGYVYSVESLIQTGSRLFKLSQTAGSLIGRSFIQPQSD